MFKAAAERKIAPTFVGFITFSRTAIRLALLQTSETLGSCGRCIAHNIPLVNLNPVNCVSTSNGAVYTGTSLHLSIIGFASPSICLRSTSIDIGSHPASNALSTTFGLSAMNIPFSGSCLLRS